MEARGQQHIQWDRTVIQHVIDQQANLWAECRRTKRKISKGLKDDCWKILWKNYAHSRSFDELDEHDVLLGKNQINVYWSRSNLDLASKIVGKRLEIISSYR